jgi:hypothetical protein
LSLNETTVGDVGGGQRSLEIGCGHPARSGSASARATSYPSSYAAMIA